MPGPTIGCTIYTRCLGHISCILLLHALVDKLNLFIIMVAKYTEFQYNNYCIIGLSKILLLVIVWSHLVEPQSNGDVRVLQNPNDTDYSWGRLEVYLNGEWGTFCIKNGDRYPDLGFNSYSADAACRQLGYQMSDAVSKASDHIDDIPLASNSTPIHTGRSVCGKNTNGGFSHVLRCFYLDTDHDIMDSTCTHDDDVIIECSIFDLNEYDTELFLNSEALNSTYRSSGVLEIFSSHKNSAISWGWSNICGTKFDQSAANTACIQLGYTGALSYYTTSANRSKDRVYTDIWLDGVTCGENTYRCLDSCFCYPQTLTAVPCDLDNVIALTCTFDLAKRDAIYPARRDMCEEVRKTYCPPDTPIKEISLTKFIIVSAVLSTVIVVLSLVVVGLMVMMCNRRGRAQYQTII